MLVTAAGLGVSSATVRSILARLEDEGFVQQPHTSAGRIPTDRGYRFYVDLLLDSKRSSRTANAVEARLRRDHAGRAARFDAARRLAHGLAGLGPHRLRRCGRRRKAAVFDRVEFIPLSTSRVLVVIVARGGHVIQKVIEIAEPLGADDLREAANYLNAEFSGLPLARAREAVRERINEERLLYDALLAPRDAPGDLDVRGSCRAGGTIYVDGAASLLEETHGLTLGTLQTLLQMMEEKQRLVRLLNEYIDGPGLTVVIGAEHLDPNLRSFSLIVVDLRRRDGDRHGGRDRTDAHAVFARHRRGRRRRAGRLARPARSKLGTYD